MTDAELTEVYRLHSDAVLRYCGYRLGSRMDAEDATSEVFARLIVNADRVRPDKRGHWLFAVARNVCTDRLRASVKETAPPPPELAGEPGEPGVDVRVRAAVALLSTRQQEVMFLRVFEDLPFAEIGRICGRSEVAVRVQYHRAMTRLRHSLEGVNPCLEPRLESE